MKLVQFQCIVAVIRAEKQSKDKVESHTIWINPDDVQMIGPEDADNPERVTIFFRDNDDSTGVEGTFAEVVEKLTTA